MGILIGVVNSTIGACGGIIAVECLKKNNINQTRAHATAVSIILPLTIVSAILYIYKNSTILNQSLIFIIPGMIGAYLGAAILPQIPSGILKKIFSAFMIYAGIRMILR